MPLLNGLDGTRKMSKSFGNQIGITDPPGDMYGKTLSIPDELIESWYGLLLGADPPAGVGPRDAKRALARGLVERFHGAAEAVGAEESFDRVFIARALPEDIPEVEIAANGGDLHLPQVIVELFGGSRSEARRKLQQGGVKLDGEPMAADPLDVSPSALDGRVMQLGKRQFRRIKISSANPL
jgi:tyrosyl-tRNA synthetase